MIDRGGYDGWLLITERRVKSTWIPPPLAYFRGRRIGDVTLQPPRSSPPFIESRDLCLNPVAGIMWRPPPLAEIRRRGTSFNVGVRWTLLSHSTKSKFPSYLSYFFLFFAEHLQRNSLRKLREIREIYREIEIRFWLHESRPWPFPSFLTRFCSKVASVETRFEGWKRYVTGGGVILAGRALVHRKWQFPIANVSVDRPFAFITASIHHLAGLD